MFLNFNLIFLKKILCNLDFLLNVEFGVLLNVLFFLENIKVIDNDFLVL